MYEQPHLCNHDLEPDEGNMYLLFTVTDFSSLVIKKSLRYT